MRSVFVRLALPLLLCSVASCASGHDSADKQLSKLQDEVTRLQSETDRMGERLDAMENLKAAAPRYSEERMANNVNTLTRPKLKVVRVEPGDSAVDDDSETEAPPADADTGPRVVIQGEGKTLETRTLPAGAAPAAAKTTKSDGSKANKAEDASSK
jgi:hypothetical protein